MKNWIARILVSALAVLITTYLLKGVTRVEIWDAIVIALVLSFLNAFLKPVLVILTIPATVLSLGLFLLVINACIILVADAMLDRFEVANFWWALLFSLILSFLNAILERIFGTNQEPR
ncbi:MAG: phage holin family protein [Bacteroidia bacterium]|nr:phage holin family protein [Bacteroidia bacterium]MCC6767740.1 phage holin family protein [Bacteroidia bacterium]